VVRRLALLLCLLAAAPALAGSGPVHSPIVRTVPHARGLVVLVHAGGWSGPDERRQRDLDRWPGRMLRAAHRSTISIDYAAGQEGLASVVAQLRRVLPAGPHGHACAYGESSGAHLALLAAAELPELRCVVGLGAPTDLDRWRDDAVLAGNAEWFSNWSQTAEPVFGASAEARWEPVAQASRIAARVLLVGQADDHVLPVRGQMAAFAGAHPATRTMVLGPGAIAYLHGSFSAASRASFARRMRSFLRGG
jgi:acetyl esterase/lipase